MLGLSAWSAVGGDCKICQIQITSMIMAWGAKALGRGRLLGYRLIEAGALGYVGGQFLLRGCRLLHGIFIIVMFLVAGQRYVGTSFKELLPELRQSQ